ncbi:LysR family transcriptional regulator [Alloyangia pacifica]|uniref:LysR family transcriptional regulator n=1 Tax=Alloyangia pacifica TaxID=311180 RepID=UPI001CFE90AA|nr:LysR family transcriptional regulator [Alloyangia pacifica]
MGNDVTLASLRLFVEVATHGSFSEAARRAGLPVSSVSRHVSGLEAGLGQRLLVRNTRAVRLTDHGTQYLSSVREALALLDTAGEEVRVGAREPRGTLRLNAPVAFGRRHIAPHLATFQARHPALEVELTLTDAFVDPVADGADVLVRVGVLEDSNLISRKLAGQRHVLAAAPEYLERRGRPKSPEELSSHNCLTYRGTHGARPWLFRTAKGRYTRHHVTGDLRSNDADSLIAAAEAGHGLVLFPTWLLHVPLQEGRLLPLLAEWEALSDVEDGAIHMLFPENRMRSLKVTAFLDFMSETVGRRPYWDALMDDETRG